MASSDSAAGDKAAANETADDSSAGGDAAENSQQVKGTSDKRTAADESPSTEAERIESLDQSGEVSKGATFDAVADAAQASIVEAAADEKMAAEEAGCDADVAQQSSSEPVETTVDDSAQSGGCDAAVSTNEGVEPKAGDDASAAINGEDAANGDDGAARSDDGTADGEDGAVADNAIKGDADIASGDEDAANDDDAVKGDDDAASGGDDAIKGDAGNGDDDAIKGDDDAANSDDAEPADDDATALEESHDDDIEVIVHSTDGATATAPAKVITVRKCHVLLEDLKTSSSPSSEQSPVRDWLQI